MSKYPLYEKFFAPGAARDARNDPSNVALDVGDVRLVLELAEGFLANGLYSPWGHDELDTAFRAYERVQAAVEAKHG